MDCSSDYVCMTSQVYAVSINSVCVVEFALGSWGLKPKAPRSIEHCRRDNRSLKASSAEDARIVAP
jgi:hypothetical protein